MVMTSDSSSQSYSHSYDASGMDPQGGQVGPLTGKRISGQVQTPVKAGVDHGRSGGAAKKTDAKAAGAFRTISEVADELDVQQHVLRFWETKFSQIRPLKRGGGRRYYRPEDLELLKRIHHLLYTEGYTIKGVQKLLKEHGKKGLLEQQPAAQAANESVRAPLLVTDVLSAGQRSKLDSVLGDLKDLRRMISAE